MIYMTLEHESKLVIASAEVAQPLIFFHLAKTGGSSIWSALIAVASSMSPSVPIIDLYHNSRTHYHSVTDIHEVLEDFREFIRDNGRVLMHHHTAYPIGPFLDRDPLYTTIIRDPVDRFISEVNHSRAVLRGEGDDLHQKGVIDPKVEMEGRGWSRDLIEQAISDNVSFEKLLECALQEPSLVRYYYWNFYHLLLGRPDAYLPKSLPSELPPDEVLADLVRSKFAYIGRFPFVFKAYLKIAQIYGFPASLSKETFPHLLQRNSRELIPGLRNDLRSAFQAEYAFLSKLGFDFS